MQLTARKRASALRAMLLWTRCKQHTVLICYTLSPNCATPRNSVFWQNIQFFSILQLTARKRASALRAMLLWTRCKQHTVLICYTLSPNCATPRNSVFWQNIQFFSILQLTARKRASALRAMLLWTRCKQHTVLFCYTLSPNCATPKHLPQRNDGIVVVPLSFVVCKKQQKLCRKSVSFLAARILY